MSSTSTAGERRRMRIVEFVGAFWAGNGYAPTVREIAQGVGLRHPSGAEYQIQLLIAAGVLQRTPRAARSLRVVAE